MTLWKEGRKDGPRRRALMLYSLKYSQVFQHDFEMFEMDIPDARQWQPNLFGTPAERSDRGLQGNRVRLTEERIEERQQSIMDLLRVSEITGLVTPNEITHQFRCDICGRRNDAFSAE
jgi:hypothetical protein